ncbi:hypothetical protein JJB09_25980 [Rhizobium sp. KVB221]|uniref:Tetratricopeptide repeat protein 38 n=1 Tax=Rhizobium setariae TaxID=2801340 RepID=A0A936YUK0_9HYPH|nr:hypothetical protein [Rhizobium setariae]MBL0375461.1 hypothetical protein [Rhizobium setariae]
MMAMTGFDSYGYALAADPAAVPHFLAGLADALSFDASGIPALEASVAADPGFPLAHAFLGRQQFIHGQRASGRAAMKRALTLNAASTKREASTVRLLDLAMEDREAALVGALEHLENWPCDVIVFSLLIGPFGLFSSSGRRDWREVSLALMEHYRSALPADDWWFVSNLSFSQAEAGQSAQALETGQYALALKETGLAVHSISHAQLELGMKDEGLRFAHNWLAGSGGNSDMRHHINWHAAVFEFDLKTGDAGHLHRHFADRMSAAVCDPMPLSTFSDNASFLWRMALRGIVPPPETVAETLAYMDRHFAFSGFAFADLHRIAITALDGGVDRKDALARDLRRQCEQEGTETGQLLVTLCDAFFAFAEGRYRAATALLAPALDGAVLLGGSNPQRRLVADTFEAANARLSNG